MKILQLIVENFKKLAAVEITPDGNMVVISGKNEAGKSSVLDSIEAVLRGARHFPKRPIKEGEVGGKIETHLGETVPEYKVYRKFFGSSTSLVVEKIDGDVKSEVRSPQAFLDSVVGEISFDPLAFFTKTSVEQRTALMEFLGLNLAEFTQKIEAIKSQRSEVLKEKNRNLVNAEQLTFTPGLPPQEQSSASLLKEFSEIRDHNKKCQLITSDNAVRKGELQRNEEDIHAAEEALKSWQSRLEKLQAARILLEKTIQIGLSPISTVEVQNKLNSLSATNEAIRNNNAKNAAAKAASDCVENYQKLGGDIKVVENQKAKKLAEAVMPVDGLTILPDGLAYNGTPIEDESESKRLKICVQIAMAMNPNLKVLRIDGNSLDKESLATIGRIADKQDYQIWVEKVSDDKTIGFYIEDGSLVTGENNDSN